MRVRILMGAVFFLWVCFDVDGQEAERLESIQQMENVSTDADEPIDLDDVLYLSEVSKREVLFLNQSDLEDWIHTGLVTNVQAQQFLIYRAQFGPLVSLYELQAVPGWDLSLIERLLPCIQLSDRNGNAATMRERFLEGAYILEQRWGRVFDQSAAMKMVAKQYVGTNDYGMMRLSYAYKNLVHWGVLVEKDIGEYWWDKKRVQRFDFVSAHLSLQKVGVVRSIVLGDYTLQFGQGLLVWQGLAFKKSLQLSSISRQGVQLRPYRSTGESLFYRGAAVQFLQGSWSFLPFVSFRKLDAIVDTLGTDGAQFQVRNILTSGYHRTVAERSHRGMQYLLTAGTALRYQHAGLQIGVQLIAEHYRRKMEASSASYALFDLQGRKHEAISVDYAKIWGPVHFFGELARSFPGGMAWVQGVILQPDPRLGLSFLYRGISPAFLSVAGNALTERSLPQGERGVFMGMTYEASKRWKVDAYVDRFEFPWLRYRIPSPSFGTDVQLQVQHTPSKKLQASMRCNYEASLKVTEDPLTALGAMTLARQINMRTDLLWTIHPRVVFHGRMEWVWQLFMNSNWNESGFLALGRVSVQPARVLKKIDLSISSFQTINGTVRVYHYEPDVGAGFGIRGYSGEGFRWALLVKKSIAMKFPSKKAWDLSFRLSQTIEGHARYDVVAGYIKPESQGLECRVQLSTQF